MNTDIDAYRPDPGRTGSPACIAVLLVLNRWRTGLRFSELVSESGLDESDVRAAVTGLNLRERIDCIGRGPAAIWKLVYTAHFAHAPQPAAQHLAMRGLQ